MSVVGVEDRTNARLGLYTKFPVEQLIAYLNKRFVSQTEASLAIGMNRHQVATWVRKGGVVNVKRADEIACRLGVHPCVIWPELWFEIDPKQQEAICRRREKNKQRSQARKASSQSQK